MNNFTPHAPYFLYSPVYFGLTFVELDPEVIVSSRHQEVRLRKMHETELLTKLHAERKLEPVQTGCAVG